MFPDMEMTIICEKENISSYELSSNNKSMRLHFAVSADDKHLPVALASMASKYIRELMMAQINGYFVNYDSDLKPTAGYWKDGTRFVEQINQIANLQYDKNQLIRSR